MEIYDRKVMHVILKGGAHDGHILHLEIIVSYKLPGRLELPVLDDVRKLFEMPSIGGVMPFRKECYLRYGIDSDTGLMVYAWNGLFVDGDRRFLL